MEGGGPINFSRPTDYWEVRYGRENTVGKDFWEMNHHMPYTPVAPRGNVFSPEELAEIYTPKPVIPEMDTSNMVDDFLENFVPPEIKLESQLSLNNGTVMNTIEGTIEKFKPKLYETEIIDIGKKKKENSSDLTDCLEKYKNLLGGD